jgi:hypothetical protein
MIMFTTFTRICAVWTTAVAAIGAASLPAKGWPYVLSHPALGAILGELWLLIPLTAITLAVAGSGGPLEPFLLSLRKRPLQPDRRAWAERLTVVLLLDMIVFQTLETGGLALDWRVPAYAAAVRGGPHMFGLPDPGHWVYRSQFAVAGLVFAWFGNGLPKLLSPYRGGREPYDWGQMMRLCGWSIMLGGLGEAVCAVLIPDFRATFLAAPACLAAGFAACLPIWLVYRLGGRPTGAAPPTAG